MGRSLMVRTDVVVPGRLVSGLRVPSVSVTTGGADVEWVGIPTSRWRFRRRPVQRLPLDPRSARRARRYIRFGPWWSVVLLVWVGVGMVEPSVLGGPMAFVVGLVAVVGAFPYLSGALPRQTPYLTAGGDLRVPGVPVEVAEQWVALNPGVVVTAEPAPRRRSRRWYAAWSTGLLIGAIGLFTVLANDGREDFVLVRVGALVLFVTGVAAALKTLPPGYLRFENDDS